MHAIAIAKSKIALFQRVSRVRLPKILFICVCFKPDDGVHHLGSERYRKWSKKLLFSFVYFVESCYSSMPTIVIWNLRTNRK